MIKLLTGGGKYKVLAPSGRVLYRHSSNLGTVMEFNDGQPRKVLVADSIFRGNRRFGMSYRSSNLPIIRQTKEITLNPYNSTVDSNPTIASTISDAWINANITQDPNTSKFNCDRWMQYTNVTDDSSWYWPGTITNIYGVPAVQFCRSKRIMGRPLDLPNINILVRIYCDADLLDKMDPTVKTNPYYYLSHKNPQGFWIIGIRGSGGLDGTNLCYNNIATASTRCQGEVEGRDWAEDDDRTWSIYREGKVKRFWRRDETAIIPILEL